MIQRKKHLDYNLIKLYFKQKDKINRLLKKSFLKNYSIKPLNRLSFIISKNYYNRSNRFVNSQNKLQCWMGYSFSVPNKTLNYSRFYLTKSTDRLVHGGFQKKKCYKEILFLIILILPIKF